MYGGEPYALKSVNAAELSIAEFLVRIIVLVGEGTASHRLIPKGESIWSFPASIK